MVDGLQEAQQREGNDLDKEHPHQRRTEAAVAAFAGFVFHRARVPGPIDRPAGSRAHRRFLHRASFALIASCTNTASPSARFSKYSVKRASAVYMSPRHRCISWLHG